MSSLRMKIGSMALCSALALTVVSAPANAALAYGPRYQYPTEGGTWEYGFWNAKVRSYYTVNRCHGSTVSMDNRSVTSINTAAGKKSIAELWAVQYPGAKDSYHYRIC